MSTAKLIYDTPIRSPDFFYATHFEVHDPALFLEYQGKRSLVLNDLEIDRAKKQARVDRVLSINPYRHAAQLKKKNVTFIDILDAILIDFGIKSVVIPRSTSCAIFEGLRKKRYRVEIGEHPFFPERYFKTREEQKEIEKAQRNVFAAMKLAEETLRRSTIRNGYITFRGKRLTSEEFKKILQIFLLERGYLAGPNNIILAGGKQSCDPHDSGRGPLKAHQSIIVDIFPQSMKSFYHGDATRTFCKGRAPDALKKLYATVKRGQELGMSLIKAEIDGKKVHTAIQALFEREGYITGERRGRMVGFFHGTGHGIGLEVHEEPVRINASSFQLKARHVVSVEPGLYYPDIGGVRIEDLVCVTKSGCNVLAGYKKQLEIR